MAVAVFPIRTIIYRLQLCIVSCLTHTCLPSYCLSFYDYVYLMDMCGTTNKCIHGREYSYTCINNNRMVTCTDYEFAQGLRVF